ncbi:ROK family protein [Bifidobacterium adolescentis]|uniref:ROK family protein n=1 Tax=Bifidobacterium adolescentis TaxID=1680 RepID=UPI0035655E33
MRQSIMKQSSKGQWRFTLPDRPWTMAVTGSELPSEVALLVASGKANSKAELVRETELARSTVSSCVDGLLRKGNLAADGVISQDRGRPAERLTVNNRLGLMAVADVGARHTTFGLADMNMRLLAHESHVISIADQRPEDFLSWASECLWRMASNVAPDLPLRHAVLSLPARIDIREDALIRPPIMPGWDAFDAVRHMGDELGCPVSVENDTNIRALGDAAALPEDERPIIEIKIGTGIGGGIVMKDGRIFHGFDGSAGEVGHTSYDPRNRKRCACGQTGCLETVASVPAMLRRMQQLSPMADEPTSVEQLIERLLDGNLGAEQAVEEAGESIGIMVATLCNILNPRHVIVSGLIAEASDELLTAIRTTVYKTARPLTTRNLSIGRSPLGRLAGVAGGVVLATQETLSPARLFEKE